MEIARHWRMQRDRYNLRGEIKELDDGRVQFRLNGHTGWTEPQPNGHHRHENPTGGKVIYQAEHLTNSNGQSPVEVHSGVEISSSSG